MGTWHSTNCQKSFRSMDILISRQDFPYLPQTTWIWTFCSLHGIWLLKNVRNIGGSYKHIIFGMFHTPSGPHAFYGTPTLTFESCTIESSFSIFRQVTTWQLLTMMYECDIKSTYVVYGLLFAVFWIYSRAAFRKSCSVNIVHVDYGFVG